MTLQAQVINDPKYIPVLDHGFVGLVDTLGTDASIVQAARVSYGDGTKTVREDRGLIRYLMRHRHTSPFEMCQVKIHIKMPIFVMRQWVRHRTASLNEYSGRYSVMTDEFYVPEMNVIQPQSIDNKQGRAGEMSAEDRQRARDLMSDTYRQTYDAYKLLLGERDTGEDLPDGACNEHDGFSDDYNGIAREMARSVLPVGNYTELYWTQNLHNMMHLLKLRMDPHAQYEIRAYAEAVYALIADIYPAALEAFDDYVRGSVNVSRMERTLLRVIMASEDTPSVALAKLREGFESDTKFAEHYELSVREYREFKETWGL